MGIEAKKAEKETEKLKVRDRVARKNTHNDQENAQTNDQANAHTNDQANATTNNQAKAHTNTHKDRLARSPVVICLGRLSTNRE